jgi:GcrA cell cycle regulator
MSWTDERIQELSRLWQAGHSASEIGKLLGVSKNAVVGKAHRLKLPSRPSPIKQQASHVANADSGGPVRAVGQAGGQAGGSKPARSRKPAPASAGASAAASPGPAAAADAGAGPRGAQAPAAAGRATGGGQHAGPAAPQRAKAASAGPAEPTSTVKPARSNGATGATGARAAAGERSRSAAQRQAVEARGSAGGCLWPIGDPGDKDFHFCGAQALPGKPYCAEHAARAYITRSRSERGEEAA